MTLSCIIPFSAFSQMRGNFAPLAKIDTMWFDINWQVTGKKNATFYRIYTKSGGGYKIWDRYKNHSIQMTAFSTTINPLFKEGSAVYYNNNGFLSSTTTYKHNDPIGKCIWYYKNETDSTVALYSESGSANFIYNAKSVEVQYNDGFDIDVLPVLKQGVPNMHDVIARTVKYPAEAKAKKIKGKAIVRFTVTVAGSVENVKIEKSSGNALLDAEASRVIKALPKFTPGKKDGKYTSCSMVVPVSFPFK